MEYICRLAIEEDLIKKFDDDYNETNDINLYKWKELTIERYNKGVTYIYIGLLNNEIISECSCTIDPSYVSNSSGLVGDKIAYLHGFLTKDKYQGMGYFSKLFKFMIEDLKNKGYKKVTLGVLPGDKKNRKIYEKYGFTEYIKTAPDIYPDGKEVDIIYYGKNI